MDRRTTGNLYEARKPFRKLRVLVDIALMEPTPKGPPITKRQVFADLCEHDLIEAFRYADEGPPVDLPRNDHGGVPGSVVTAAAPEIESDAVTVVYSDADHVYTSWAGGDAINLAASDIRAPAYQDMGHEAAAAQRRRDAVAQQVAEQALGVDIYVTDRPYLHNPSWNLAPSVAVCGVDDALPMVGLYLRSQGEYLVQHNYRFNKGLYYWVGTRELLPSAWRWFSACVAHSSARRDDRLTVLGGSLLQRVDRALEARDAIHVALNQPQDNDRQDDALAQLDVILLFLMGAVDASARVAHIVFEMPPTDLHRAAWQSRRRGGWLASIRTHDPSLAAVVDPGTGGFSTLEILRLLRNSVHGEALQGLAIRTRSDPLESVVGLPEGDTAELLQAMDMLGGRDAWGVGPELAGRFHVDPGVFADRLFEAVLQLLNDLMSSTPVERLAVGKLAPERMEPPSDGPWQDWMRSSIRWQLGL